MNGKPAYFEPIRCEAAEKWEQREQDPEVAGLLQLMFMQVQNPRLILSELLQNADDAGATEASVRIANQVFIFEHNGEDFTEENFASLCKFGCSNKRTLHTIGFRGIGFKSTFSLGDCVKLFTPSLATGFHRKRFTEPQWLSERPDTCGKTRIEVAISDQHRRKEVEKSLEHWRASPVSLLFFNNIRSMQIGNHEVHGDTMEPGPIPASEWMVLSEEKKRFLLIRSEAESFPDEALAEIRQERPIGEETEFPPCKIEIVLGAKGRLYAVLPTGIETELPFACNAPFIQDPARLKIKELATSPTNRWLLERVGKLAASAMLHWLEQREMSTIERARAYGLFPAVARDDSSLEGGCGNTIQEAFSKVIEGRHLLLTEDGRLTAKKQSIAIPRRVIDIWPAEQATEILDKENRPALCQHIELSDRKKLLHWGIVDEINKPKFLATLQSTHPPKPKTWRQLMALWAYIAPDVAGYGGDVRAKNIRIVPVQGRDVLYPATKVVRLGEKKLLQSEADWEFLATHLIVLKQQWPSFLAEQRRIAENPKDEAALKTVSSALGVLEKIGLIDTSNVNKVIDQVAAGFFGQESISLPECVQLAQIAAKLSAKAGNSFRYATKDESLRGINNNILFDKDGALEELIPEQQRETQLLHSEYLSSFNSCTKDEWLKWVLSGRSGFLCCIPFVQTETSINGKKQIEKVACERGLEGDLSYHYKYEDFILEDWNFEKIYWDHWTALTANDDRLWTRLVNQILAQSNDYWSCAKSARIFHEATTGNRKPITDSALLPSWVLHLRDVPCLLDTRGFPHKPGDLLRRTPETESLMGVESFVQGLHDRETTRTLLDLLGVRSTPTGPDRLLDCLRALAKSKAPPVRDVERWYRRLDQMVDTCSTTDSQKIQHVFRAEKLVLTLDGTWVATPAVFLSSNEEDVPDAAIVRPSVSDLTLWRKIGVAERPSAELAIEWLKTLPSGQALAHADAHRVRALLERYPKQIWEECSHWLNLTGEWMPVDVLSYAFTRQPRIHWKHLHPCVKQKTADLCLPAEVTSNPPFSHLPSLAQHIKERLPQDFLFPGQPEIKGWLTALGDELRRVEFGRGEEEDTKRVRALAEILARTGWLVAPGLKITPYIDNTPAGTARNADVLWCDDRLYVDQLPKAKLARRVPEEIGKAFDRADIKAALHYSFERSPADVREYLEENFKLVSRANLPEKTCVSGDEHSVEDPGFSSPEPDVQTRDPAETTNETSDESTDDGATIVRQDEALPGKPDLNEPTPRPRPAPKPAKPSIIERFAKAQGFRKDSEERFSREDGNWIGRSNGARFLWEQRTATGTIVRYYWARDHCLEREPLQIEADIWGLVAQNPGIYALILSNIEGEPVEMTGARLRAMRDNGEITLYPASYRLVYDHGSHT